MKRITLLVGILAAANILFAQNKREMVREKAPAKIEQYHLRLDLSEAQVTELKRLKEKYHPEMEAIRSNDATSKSDKMRAAADVIEKREKEVSSILTTEQEAEWKAIQDEMQERRQQHRERQKQHRGQN